MLLPQQGTSSPGRQHAIAGLVFQQIEEWNFSPSSWATHPVTYIENLI